MKRAWRILLIAGACAVLAIITALVWPGEREPVYKGKKLSEWIRGCADEKLSLADKAERIEAVRHIGTNALPYLLKWIEGGGYPRAALSKVDSVVIKVVPKKTAHSWLKYRDRNFYRSCDTFAALQMLDYYDRIPAIPELVRLSQSTNQFVASVASSALSRMELDPKTALRDYIQYTNRGPRSAVRPTNTPAKSKSTSAAPGRFAVGHLWKTNSKAHVPEEAATTNSKPSGN